MKWIESWKLRAIAAAAFILSSNGALAQSFQFGLEPAPAAKYGAIPNAYSPLIGSALPPRHDLSPDMPPPGKQANQSCVGWAVAYALKTYQERTERNWSITRPDGSLDANRIFSPAFIYNQINGGQDRGSNFGDAFRVLATQGAAPWSAMPYRGQAFEPVPAAARAAAAPYRIDTFRTIDHRNPAEVKTQLVAGFPVIIGSRIHRQFVNLPANGIWTYADGPNLGNHAMVVVGYDDERQAFKVINSWGREWSSGGYGWISYGLFTQVVNEAYVVVDLKGVDAEAGPATPDVWTPPTIAPEASTIVVDQQFINPNFYDPQLQAIGLRIQGRVTIPRGVRGTARVVIPLTLQSGQAVGSLSPAFALATGQAAFGTPPLPLDGSGVTDLPWYAFVPYCALNLPKTKLCIPQPSPAWILPAQSNLRAAPILFIDNFGVAKGADVNFFVRL